MAPSRPLAAPSRRIGVEGDPLQDPRTLQHVSFVMKGRIFKGGGGLP